MRIGDRDLAAAREALRSLNLQRIVVGNTNALAGEVDAVELRIRTQQLPRLDGGTGQIAALYQTSEWICHVLSQRAAQGKILIRQLIDLGRNGEVRSFGTRVRDVQEEALSELMLEVSVVLLHVGVGITQLRKAVGAL